ncbi:MAG: DUF4845 domain-containing protein [Terriglobia bacterium]
MTRVNPSLLTEARLPLWRAITGFAMLAIFLGVLAALAPIYLENYQLARYVHTLGAAPSSQAMPDEALRSEVAARAHELHLPVVPADVQIDRANGKLHVQAAYHVQMDLSLYAINLHMSAR